MGISMLDIYKPDSKKVGALYKLWIKKECNNLQISYTYILFTIEYR